MRDANNEAPPDAAAAASGNGTDRQGSTLAQLIAAGAEFDALLIDPRRQLAALNEFYLDGPGTLDRCLQIYRVMAPASVAFVLTRFRHIGVVETELLPRCGFSRLSGVVELEETATANIAEAKVLITAQRGGAKLMLPDRGAEHAALMSMRPTRIVESLCPGARKLNAFANSHAPGWTTLIGDNAWIEVPTLR